MLTQSQVYRLFGEIDRLPGIMEPHLGRWRAWPIAKLPLVWHLMQERSPDEPIDQAAWLRKFAQRLPRYGCDLAIALRQYRNASSIPEEGVVGMMFLPRPHRLADGRTQDFIFGDLLEGHGLLKPSLALEQPWPTGRPARRSNGTAIDLRPYHSATEQLAVLFMASPRLRRVAANLNTRLGKIDMEIDGDHQARKILVALCLFEARRRMFRRLAARLRLRALVVSYGPGRFAEIAAARELNLPVIELQHGVIGPHCPDYAWPAEYRAFKNEIPLPDRIAVFGEMFQDLILRSGFLRDFEIHPVGGAAIEMWRGRSRCGQRATGALRVVFMTQATSRQAALQFWREVAQTPRFRETNLRIVLKIHPEEWSMARAYQEIAALAPDAVEVLPSDSNPIDAMLDAHVVVSYNSMALVEALGLGVPVISICGGSIPGGFAGSFDLKSITTVMPHIHAPDELLDVLHQRAADEQQLSQWRSAALERGRKFFADGFDASAKTLINDILAQSAGSPSQPVVGA